MQKISIEGAALDSLREQRKRVEVCDPEGRIVGYFEPSKFAGFVMPPDPTDEELAESEEGETYTLDEAWAMIRRGELP